MFRWRAQGASEVEFTGYQDNVLRLHGVELPARRFDRLSILGMLLTYLPHGMKHDLSQVVVDVMLDLSLRHLFLRDVSFCNLLAAICSL